MVTLFCCIIAYLSIVNSQPSNYIVPFNDLVVGDYVLIKGTSGGYLTDNEDGSTLISSSTYRDTAIWEVRNDFSSAGIEFKNIETGLYIRGDGTKCFVSTLQGSGNWGGWQQQFAGTFDNDQHTRCCCADSADDNTITHGNCGLTCAQFTFYVIRTPSFRTIASFNSLSIGDFVIIESASGLGGYLTDNEDGSTLVTNSEFNGNSAQIWEVRNDFHSPGIEFKNLKTGLYIRGDGTKCFVSTLQGSGNWGGWQQKFAGTFDNDQHTRCCCADSNHDNTITHGNCGLTCAQFIFHRIISDTSSLCSSSSFPSPLDTFNYYDNLKLIVEVSSMTFFIILSVMINFICCIWYIRGKFNRNKYNKYNKVDVNSD